MRHDLRPAALGDDAVVDERVAGEQDAPRLVQQRAVPGVWPGVWMTRKCPGTSSTSPSRNVSTPSSFLGFAPPAAERVAEELAHRAAPEVRDARRPARVAALAARPAQERLVVLVDEHAHAGLVEERRQAGVVAVGVGEHDGVDVARRDAERAQIGRESLLKPGSPASTALNLPPSSTRYQFTCSEPRQYTPGAISRGYHGGKYAGLIVFWRTRGRLCAKRPGMTREIDRRRFLQTACALAGRPGPSRRGRRAVSAARRYARGAQFAPERRLRPAVDRAARRCGRAWRAWTGPSACRSRSRPTRTSAG